MLDPVIVPKASISARPMFWPCAPLIVNFIHVTVFAGKEIGRPLPPGGSAPTCMKLPSLKVSVPEVTLSVVLGRS